MRSKSYNCWIMRYPDERRKTENAALRQGIAELERLGNDYADLMLMDTEVHIDLNDMEAMFTLPPRAAEAFQDMKVLRPDIMQYITFITQALRAASDDLLG